MIVFTIEDIIGISAIIVTILCLLYVFIATKIEEFKIKRKIRRNK